MDTCSCKKCIVITIAWKYLCLSTIGQGEYDDVTRDGLQIRQTAEEYGKDNQGEYNKDIN